MVHIITKKAKHHQAYTHINFIIILTTTSILKKRKTCFVNPFEMIFIFLVYFMNMEYRI